MKNTKLDIFKDKPKEFKKLKRILVYPNITFIKDLEKDSYIQVIKKQIELLNKIRDDLWFYLVLPKKVNSLSYDNCTQIFTHFESYPPTMRLNFDVSSLKKLINNDMDIDLVMSHLPEHTQQLNGFLHNLTHHSVKVFGYCHWFDLKEIVSWGKHSFNTNVLGLLEYERCYLNTDYQKNLVMNQAKDVFNDSVIKKLDSILTPQYLGVDKKDIRKEINKKPKKIIVFNHRPHEYKDFNNFMSIMDKLREKRQDFKVWIPLLEKPNRKWVETSKGNKQWYYDKLSECCVGFSPKQKYGGWSVSTTDGLMNGTPFIMYNEKYYHELQETADFFSDNNEAIELLEKYLDNTDYRNEKAKEGIKYVEKNLIYKNEIKKMSDYIDTLIEETHCIGNKSDTINKIVDYIKKNKKVSKKELIDYLGWGRTFSWTPYRMYLMKHPNIYDMKGEQSYYVWKEK